MWANDTADQAGYVVTETPIDDGEYPALSDIAPAAFVEECEIYEQFGIRPATGKPLNRMMLPPHASLPTLGRQPPAEPEEARAPHLVGGEAFEFPFGPVRQVGVESLYYGLVTSGEEVVDLYLFTWHKHRGLEWRLQGKTPEQALFLAERTEGLSAVAMTWALAAAAEAATGVQPAKAAQRTRAVALELERLYNHAAAMAALCQSTGLSVGQSAAEIALERLLRLNARAFGHRYLFGVIGTGGASRAPDADAIREELPGAYGEFKRAADALLGTNSFVDRLEATGILTPARPALSAWSARSPGPRDSPATPGWCRAARTENRRPSPPEPRAMCSPASRSCSPRPPSPSASSASSSTRAPRPARSTFREPRAPGSAGPSRPAARHSPG